jgi:tetratricopeptide (TPR) repeat protein
MDSRVVDRYEHAAKLDPFMRARMRKFVRNEITWAEVEGMTFEQARAISRTAMELAARGRLQDAKVLFEGLVAGNPKDTASLTALGSIYQRLNRKDDALACYDEAIRLFDQNFVALASRGELRLRAGDRQGIEDLKRAAAIDAKGLTAAGKRARTLVASLARRPAQARPSGPCLSK